MLIEMPELGTLEGKQAANFAGLAPISRQSGKWQGKERFQGGRAFLRRAIYMPALVATRYNPDLKAKYDQLIGAGKPGKVAIIAIMRKLLITANALLRVGGNGQQSGLDQDGYHLVPLKVTMSRNPQFLRAKSVSLALTRTTEMRVRWHFMATPLAFLTATKKAGTRI